VDRARVADRCFFWLVLGLFAAYFWGINQVVIQDSGGGDVGGGGRVDGFPMRFLDKFLTTLRLSFCLQIGKISSN
jgi:hypothetical protein